MKHLHLELDDGLFELLRAIAFQSNRSKSDISRRAIKKYLEELLEKKNK